MKLTTDSVKHLKISSIKVKKTTFPEGELYVRIMSNVRKKKVTIVSNITPDNILEILFLVDAAKRAGAKVNLKIPYMSYARQDKIYFKGESITGGVICSMLKSLKIPITIFDIHSQELKKYLNFKNASFLPLLASKLPKKDFVVVTPDKGGAKRARVIAKQLKVPLMIISKTRKGQKLTMKFTKQLHGKNVLIVEDMISTGGTLAKATKLLKEHGAKDVYCISAHGLFIGNSKQKLKQAGLKKIIVSNSLPNKSSNLIQVVNIKNLV